MQLFVILVVGFCIVPGCGSRSLQIVSGVQLPSVIDQLISDSETTTVKGEVQLRNVGNESREVTGITASCTCSSITPAVPFTIPPKSTEVLKYEIEFPQRDRDRHVDFSLRFQNGAVAQLAVLLTRGELFAITPPAYDFGTIIEGAKVSTTVTVDAPAKALSKMDLGCESRVHVRNCNGGLFEVTLDSAGLAKGLFSTDVRFSLKEDANRILTLTGVIKPLYGIILEDLASKGTEFKLIIIRADSASVPVIDCIRVEPSGEITDFRQDATGNSLRCLFEFETSENCVRQGDAIVICFRDGTECRHVLR